MVYLTCTKHRSYQRKHIAVCRKCQHNDACDAYRSHTANEPSVPREPVQSAKPRKTPFPVPVFLNELMEIRTLVADRQIQQKRRAEPAQEGPSNVKNLVDYIQTELEGIRKLC